MPTACDCLRVKQVHVHEMPGTDPAHGQCCPGAYEGIYIPAGHLFRSLIRQLFTENLFIARQSRGHCGFNLDKK